MMPSGFWERKGTVMKVVTVSVLVIVLLSSILAITMMKPSIPVTPDPPELPPDYDYIVGGNEVRNDTDDIVFNGSSFTQAVNWATKQTGKVTYVPPGTYYVSDYIWIGNRLNGTGATLIGGGSGPNGTILNFTTSATVEIQGVSDAVIKNLRITGYGGVRIMNLWNSTNTTVKDILIQDVICDRIVRSDAAFQVRALGGVAGDYGIIDGVQFIRCQALSPQCSGWFLCGDIHNIEEFPDGMNFLEYTRSINTWVRNVSFEDCKAYRCGVDGQPNVWVCGFILAETTNVENITLQGCQADHSWMNGYHFEGGPYVINVVFEDCDASYNGVGQVDSGANTGWSYWENPPYLNQVSLVNCTSNNNFGGGIFTGN